MYTSPEVLLAFWRGERAVYSEACDIYGLALVMFELFCAMPLLAAGETFDPEDVVTGARPRIPEYFTAQYAKLAKLIQRCWDPHPKERPTANELLLTLKQTMFKLTLDIASSPAKTTAFSVGSSVASPRTFKMVELI